MYSKMLIKVDKVNINTKSNKQTKSFTAINTTNNEVGGEKNFIKNIYGGLKMWITLLFLNFITFSFMHAQDSFLENQLTYSRFKEAYQEKEPFLKQEFKEQGLSWPAQEILIRSFKHEQEFEIWVRNKEEFVLFKTYSVCEGSGNFGPKFKQGDGQVPEGFYYIDRFNPVSSFHLSLGLNYPNEADLLRTIAEDPGGDIFIHGDCVTIGCLPMTDDKIKEIYVLAVLAKSAGQDKIPVQIFPYRFTFLNNTIFSNLYKKHVPFWNNLEEEYNNFIITKRTRDFYINKDAKYIFID